MYVLQVPNAKAKDDEEVSFLYSLSILFSSCFLLSSSLTLHSLAPFASRRLRIVPLLSLSENQNTHKAINESHL
jgi:hypothetical protein